MSGGAEVYARRVFELEVERTGEPLARERIETAEVVVGRSRALALRVVSGRVARHHVRIREVDGRLVAEDLQSTNGTTVDGVRATTAELTVGSVVGLPECTLTVTRFEPLIARDFADRERAFVSLLARDTNDDAAREVYADALEEAGERLRAAWLREELAVRRGRRPHAALAELTERLAAAPGWLARVARS